MEIELTNIKTGEVQHITEDNMFTKALYYYLNENYGGVILNKSGNPSSYSSYNHPSDMFPLVERGLGGLMLLPENEVEDEENLYPHSFPTAVAVKDREDYGANRLMGLYNTAQSGPIENGFKFVYEFMTTQGNGTIACACLTNPGAWNTNTIDVYNSGDYVIENNNDKRLNDFRVYKSTYNSTSITEIYNTYIVGVVNGKLYMTTGDRENTKYSLVNPIIRLYDTNIVLTGCNKVTDIGINTLTTNSLFNNGRWIASIEIPYDYSQFNTTNYLYTNDPICISAYPYTDNNAIIFVSVNRRYTNTNSKVGADGWADCYILDLTTYEISFLRTITFPYIDSSTEEVIIPTQGERRSRNITTSSATNALELCWEVSNYVSAYNGYGWFDYPNLVYVPRYIKNGAEVSTNDYVVKVNIVDGEISVYDLGQRINGSYTMNQIYPKRNIIGFDTKVLNLDTGRFRDIKPMRIKNDYMFCPIGNKLMHFNNKAYKGNSSNRDYYAFGRHLTYMATINNLSSPITKSSEQTMKITYTIMDAEG